MGKIRIKNVSDVRHRLDEVLDTLREGPVFIAKNKRVTAVMMDMSDYYDLLGELEDMAELLHSLGGCGCGCEEEHELDRVLDAAFDEESD